MKLELLMRKDRRSVDAFAVFRNVGSMSATEQNFAKLRKPIQRARRKMVKEVKMKQMKGVSVVDHPFFGMRGSFDGEKMVVAFRVKADTDQIDNVMELLGKMGFKEGRMALARHRGLVKEFDYIRPTTHLSMSDVANGGDMELMVAQELLRLARCVVSSKETYEV